MKVFKEQKEALIILPCARIHLKIEIEQKLNIPKQQIKLLNFTLILLPNSVLLAMPQKNAYINIFHTKQALMYFQFKIYNIRRLTPYPHKCSFTITYYRYMYIVFTILSVFSPRVH